MDLQSFLPLHLILFFFLFILFVIIKPIYLYEIEHSDIIPISFKIKNIEQNTFQLIVIIPGQITEAFIKYKNSINSNNADKEEELKCVQSQSQNNTECYFEPNFEEENTVINILSIAINEQQKCYYEISKNTLIPHPSKLIEFENKSNLDNTGVNLELQFNGNEQPIIEINDGTHKIIEYQNPIVFENIDNQNIYYFTFHYSSFSYEMTFDLHSSLLNKNFQKQNLRTLQDTCTHNSPGSKSNVELIDFISSSRFGDPVGIHFQYNKVGSSEEETYPIFYVVNDKNITFNKTKNNCTNVVHKDDQSFSLTCYITTNEKASQFLILMTKYIIIVITLYKFSDITQLVQIIINRMVKNIPVRLK